MGEKTMITKDDITESTRTEYYSMTITNQKDVFYRDLSPGEYDALKIMFFGFRSPCELVR